MLLIINSFENSTDKLSVQVRILGRQTKFFLSFSEVVYEPSVPSEDALVRLFSQPKSLDFESLQRANKPDPSFDQMTGILQGSAREWIPGFENFPPALAELFCWQNSRSLEAFP